MTDRYEEGRAAGIAEGRAQAFREAAEVARNRERNCMARAASSSGPSQFDTERRYVLRAQEATARGIAEAIEAKAKEK